VLSALLATGEGCFNPALAGLQADVVRPAFRPDANALLGVAESAADVLGPALAGALIALTGPAVVIALDAASFGVSVLALARLSVPLATTRPATQSPWRDLADGWQVFTSQTWLWVGTVQFALFNLFTWAPYLLLGPILASRYLGGAKAWGVISAAYAAGAVLAGVVLVGRAKAKRPLVVAVLGTFGFPVPCLLLALHAPAAAVAAGALVAGAGAAVFGTFNATVIQQWIAPDMLARANAFMLTGSYALGASGYAVIGVIAGAVGLTRLLGFGAGYAVVSSAVVLALPAIRSVRWRDQPAAAGDCADTPESAPSAPAAG
jgi:predicted MFS family arabinose efflux permease